MNKKYLIGALTALAIVGCNSEEKVYTEGETAFCTGNETTDIYCVDTDKNPVTGIVKSISDNKSVEIHLKDGRPNGLMQHYENGKLVLEVDYKEGNGDMLVKTFYENGKVHIEESFKDGKKNGVLKAYNEDGTVYMEANFKDSMLDGIQKEFDKDGKIVKEDNYINGILIK